MLVKGFINKKIITDYTQKLMGCLSLVFIYLQFPECAQNNFITKGYSDFEIFVSICSYTVPLPCKDCVNYVM